MIITKTLANGDTGNVTISAAAITGFSSASATASKKITVSYTEEGITKTATFNISVVKFTGPAAPLGGAVDDLNNVFTFLASAGTHYEYSTDGGTTWTGLYTGDECRKYFGRQYRYRGRSVQVRLKATASSEAGLSPSQTAAGHSIKLIRLLSP